MSTNFTPIGVGLYERFGGSTYVSGVDELADKVYERRREALESFLRAQNADPARQCLVTYWVDERGGELNVLIPHAEAADVAREGLMPEAAKARYPFVEILTHLNPDPPNVRAIGMTERGTRFSWRDEKSS